MTLQFDGKHSQVQQNITDVKVNLKAAPFLFYLCDRLIENKLSKRGRGLTGITNWQEMSSACYHTSQCGTRLAPESDELSLTQMQFRDQHAPDD